MAFIYHSKDDICILKDYGDNIADLHRCKNIFEIDELIAYPVIRLCQKGYITEMSCSGHAYASPYFVSDDELTEQDKQNMFLYEYLDEYETYYASCVGTADLGTFIKFKEIESFESLPAGWVLQDNFLRFDIEQQINPSIYYKQVIDAIVLLTEWIETLPDKNT